MAAPAAKPAPPLPRPPDAVFRAAERLALAIVKRELERRETQR
jgi:hypothetical protein